MNEDVVGGKFKSSTGKIKRRAGEALGNEKLANSGTADEVRGAAQETWGDTKDAASSVKSAVAGDVEHSHASGTIRDKVAGAAEKTKNYVESAMDELRGKVHDHELDREGNEVHQVH